MNDSVTQSPPVGGTVRKERYGWIEYVSLIERLLRLIKEDFRPDQVIGISSGGLFPATILAKAFDAPLAVIAAESYHLSVSGIKDAKGPVQLGPNLASARPELGHRILLVDDLTDSGDTMHACANWLRYGIQPKDPGPGLVPGRCPSPAHDRDNLGLGGRRVLWSVPDFVDTGLGCKLCDVFVA